MVRRPGVPSDADAIVDVMIRTMPLDPQWDYRFPYRHEFPVDHYRYTKMLIDHFLDPKYDDWMVTVVEDQLAPGEGALSVVSFAVWDVSYRNKRLYGSDYIPQDPVTDVENEGGSTRRDANHTHFNEFWKGQIRAYKRLFSPIGPEQMHLQILATLPDYQRRGHATSLCRWALDQARRDSLKDVSVMASPMGSDLYLWLGFEILESVVIQVPGEEEKLTLKAMIYKFHQRGRPGRI